MKYLSLTLMLIALLACGPGSTSIGAGSEAPSSVASSAGSDADGAISRLVLLHWNVEFLWDGIAPEDGEADLDFPWRGSPKKAEAHMEEIAETLRRVDADLVNLTEVEDLKALELFVERHLPGMGYRPYLVDGTDTATGQDVALLSKYELDVFGRDPRRGRSGKVRKAVSKNYVATLNLETRDGRQKIGMVGLHFLAGPTRANRQGPREAQADAISQMARELASQGHSMVVWGDFNDFDGGIDDAKSSRPITRVLEWVKRMDRKTETDDLVNVMVEVPRGERYTSRGRFRNAIDHVLLSPDLASKVDRVDVLHEARGSGHSPILVELAF